MGDTLLKNTDHGLYCAAGGFHIDPWRPVESAIITHAHSDHARAGSRQYLCARPGAEILAARLGPTASIQSLPFGETIDHQGVRISLHPAGHILGSAQVRIEYRGEVWVVSGDYKTESDGLNEPFAPVRCHTFVTESTFGLPIYRWQPQQEIFDDLNGWWRQNQERGRTTVLFCYALGKAQRLLSGLDPSQGPIFIHGAVDRFMDAYKRQGARLPPTAHAVAAAIRSAAGRGIVIAPTSADNSPWLSKLGDTATAFASGWMQIRGARRRRALDRGFVLSDHADWNGLHATIKATGASTIWVTHGYTAPMVRWLRENGWQAEALKTQFEGEVDDAADSGNSGHAVPRSGEPDSSDAGVPNS